MSSGVKPVFSSISDYNPLITHGGVFEIRDYNGDTRPEKLFLDLNHFSENWLAGLRSAGKKTIEAVKKMVEELGYKMLP